MKLSRENLMAAVIEDVIARKAVVVDTTYKDGHIILIGIRCQNRAQSHGTYKFLLNSLLYPDKE